MDVNGRQELGWLIPRFLEPGQKLDAAGWVDSSTNTHRIDWQTPDGDDYTLSGDGVNNGQAFAAKLPQRQVLSPKIVPSGTHVWIEVTEDRGRARLSVSDDGPGIEEAEAANIFQRFYRVDGAQASGSGLGLAIARELVRLMGGSLELERTTFAATLPAAAPSVESATKTPATAVS
jgi:phosphoglycerate-specific signal transduction histidine kinase